MNKYFAPLLLIWMLFIRKGDGLSVRKKFVSFFGHKDLLNNERQNHLQRLNQCFMTNSNSESNLADIPVNQKESKHASIARGIGYIMGIGGMLIYMPNLLNIVYNKDSIPGYSTTTWALNFLGMMMAVAYPLKRKFHISTYLEIIGTMAQSALILGVLCWHKGLFTHFITGIVPVLTLFYLFVNSNNVPEKLMAMVQISSSLLANYANVPQIVLTYKRKQASWSIITAVLSMAGCAIRIYTSKKLTNDKLVIAGYLLGFFTNAVMFGQILYYNYL